MDYFGLNSAEDLPKLKEIFVDNLVPPTMINSHVDENDKDETPLIISENGELVETNKEQGPA